MMDALWMKQAIEYRQMIDVLMSDKEHADLVLHGGQVVNVLTAEIYEADLAMKGKYILMVGDARKLIGPETVTVDVR